MSASTAIGMVSASLRALLLGEMELLTTPVVTLLAPDESQATGRVNLFLYKVQESPYQRNRDWQVSPIAPGRLQPPPLTLNLFYLLTPYAQNDQESGNSNAHAMLGEAMRVFHEFPVVPPAYLAAGLADAREQVKITPGPLDVEELTKIWGTFTQPYRLSVPYEVSVAQIDRSPASEIEMPERVRSVGVPDFAAPFRLPVIESIDPSDGPPGTVVTVSGRHLDGWQAYVTVTGRTIASELLINGDNFDVVLPGDLQPGFQRLRVDVSHLSRQTFFFEVTP